MNGRGLSEAGEGGRWVGRQRRRLEVVRCAGGNWRVISWADHAFLRKEAVQGVTEGSEEPRVEGPVTELCLLHALQQVWVTGEVYVGPV